ncbi:glycosyltransferase family 2 protein [archaeon]|jgi:hypothetical protein|nr:glycosyltransferase family 2 protein [Candidatus Woesearchaeota archaeon]MBT3463758.1 glycosyltransferase family 2 protein [archaeon]MBT4351369.1 glycosyltransferase family 2 protein [archaeon]MBT4647549.1 glycosyltransferase family 2 protein [archaeon]MBT6821955.1 glycosyltransferase family 2 protein [archaeon]
MKTIAIIPIFNEKNIEPLINSIKNYVDSILIIDDGSVIPIKISNYTIIRNSKNKGKGYCLRRAFKFAKNFEKIIILDGDGEHSPSDIPKFVESLNNLNCLVIGRRNKQRSLIRTMLNNWADLWIKHIIPLKDFNCGFKAIDNKSLKKLNLKSNGFEIDLEILLECKKNKIPIKSISINTKLKKKSHVKLKDYIKINNFFDKWLLKNIKNIEIKESKKSFLIISSKIGLFFGKIILVFI